MQGFMIWGGLCFDGALKHGVAPLCLQSNQAVMILYSVTVALEDPFDSQGLDAIFIDEALEEARQVQALS